MNTIKSFIFTAILIATAITISCSSDNGDDGGNGGGNDLSSSGVETGSSSSAGTGDGSSSSGGGSGGSSSGGVSGGSSSGGSNVVDASQVYTCSQFSEDSLDQCVAWNKWTGSGTLVIPYSGSLEFTMGNVSNGIVNLEISYDELPESYLNDFEYRYNRNGRYDDLMFENTVSVVPADAKFGEMIDRLALYDNSNQRIGRIKNESNRIGTAENNESIEIGYFYASKAATITGTFARYSTGDDCPTRESRETYNINVQAGWNKLYALGKREYYSEDCRHSILTISTDPNIITAGIDMRWTFRED